MDEKILRTHPIPHGRAARVSDHQMQLSDNLPDATRNLPAEALKRLRFYRLVPVPLEEICLAAAKALRKQRAAGISDIDSKLRSLDVFADDEGIPLGDVSVEDERV